MKRSEVAITALALIALAIVLTAARQATLDGMTSLLALATVPYAIAVSVLANKLVKKEK